MFGSLLYPLLAVLGLSFLIFIHELGHYWMARRVGMKVDTFSIGIGRPIFSWKHDGVQWQICWLLFGGYVKIAGQDSENVDPYDVPDGFYGKSPWDRIKVAFMGPLTNLLFALLLFGILWALGGREKSFSEMTSHIGWVDPKSQLYADGIRAGDEITSYNHRPFTGSKDHLYAAITGGNQVHVEGLKFAVEQDTAKIPFSLDVKPYQTTYDFKKNVATLGVAPANYLIYDRFPNGQDNPLPEGSPLESSGIQYGDRIVWIDGDPVFSSKQLDHILNDGRALLTVQHGSVRFLARVPRVPVSELKLDTEFREELMDWQFEGDLKGIKFQQLYTIPYNLTNDCVVENPAKFIDIDNQQEAFPANPYSLTEMGLRAGDKILAVDGVAVEKSYQLLKQLQTRQVNLIVERGEVYQTQPSVDADKDFDKSINLWALNKIGMNIGTDKQISSIQNFHLLKPVTPKTVANFTRTPENEAQRNEEVKAIQKMIQGITDNEERAYVQSRHDKMENSLLLGLPYQDHKVNYNPSPFELFYNVIEEIWRTLRALVNRSLSAEWLSGPVGIMQVMHNQSMVSYKEAIYWLGVISVNLGILNLLPIPVLDGGTIMFALVEIVTRRRIPSKVLEWLVLPFAVLLITFFVFVTYHDLKRLFGF